MFIRRERSGDEAAIASVHGEAFARTDAPSGTPVEVGLVDQLRASGAWIPELSLVAVDDGEITGHVVCTRATLADRIPVLGLGPLGVRPPRQRRGTGLALVHAVLGAADALDEPLVALLGSTDYYPRFGFENAARRSIVAPEEWYGDHFQARFLTAATPDLAGTFRYAAPFDGL